MDIIENVAVPTGNILIVRGAHGPLEMLSIGDYGKGVNLKADCLGLGRIPERVKHQQMLPLEEKWVITISSQYGCSMNCEFCDVPEVGPGRNATFDDLIRQVIEGIKLHPEVEHTRRLNVHFARMGEPTWNPAVLDAAKWLKDHVDPEHRVHPVVSTMMPCKNEWLKTFVHTWMRIKNRLYHGNAGLQISVNSTDEDERTQMFSGNAHRLEAIASIMQGIIPNGRKITLNFAVANYTIDAHKLYKHFSPDDYIIKLTPMHKTRRAEAAGIRTKGEADMYYPHEDIERQLKGIGYDVIVFIPSAEEDASRITCGNAILATKHR